MIVVSGSLPKSGSTWLYKMTDALLVASGHDSAESVRRRYRLERLLPGFSNELGYPAPAKLARLLWPHARGEAILVKTHFAPSRSLRLLLGRGVARATYIYRDPRDAALSALDHGERARQRGGRLDLTRLHSVEDAVAYMRDQLRATWPRWSRCPGVLCLRYEDLLADAVATLGRVRTHLGLACDDRCVERVVERFDRDRAPEKQRHLMMVNRAVVGRFRQDMTADQRRRASRRLAPFLEQMGYAA